jgi:fimbrial isopeptide formation D2 family protein/LPXTG-motif cell wall-anchored protein
MKLRKIFAGVAAVATLLGGMAFGATAANAEDGVVAGNATFKFTADDADQWKNREVKYYKLADYVKYGTASPAYGVQTASTADRDAISAALTAAGASVPTDATTDLMAWALQKGALDSESKPWTGSTRKFADALAANANVTGNTIKFSEDETGTYRTVSLPAGVYLFVDTVVSNGDTAASGTNKGNIHNGGTNDSQGGKVVTQSAPIVLASGTVAGSTITDPLKSPVDPEKNPNGDNIIAFKNHVTPVSKTVDDADKTVSVGQTVNYTLTSTLPSITTGFTNYQFSLTDTPGEGQTVDLSSGLVVTIDDTPITQGAGTTQYELKYNGLTDDEKTANKFDGDGTKQFIIDLSKYVQNMVYDADRVGAVKVTYKATINDEAKASHTVPNTVEVNDNNSKAEDKTEVKLGKFSFTKTAADGTPIKQTESSKRVQFTISDADGDTPAGDANAVAPTEPVATADENGLVAFDGLADGKYHVQETKTAEGFMNLAAKFDVTITGGVAVYFDGTDGWGLAQDKGAAGSTAEITDYSVMNVRNVTELPKTGAAGIAMFTVIGLLIAGAAVTVFVKSRSTKRALRG